MRRLFSVGLVALVALLAACSGGSSNDPYELAFKARNAGWDQVQIDLTVNAQTGSGSVALGPGAVRLVLDTKNGKGLFHLAIPTSALGTAAAGLPIAGDTLDVDVLYDGTALYAKSPLAPTLLALLFASAGPPPSGDLTGWIKLGTAADFAALGALGAGVAPSAAPLASLADANALKTQLTAMGITLNYVNTEQHNGVNADHLTATIDWDKLAASPSLAAGASQAQAKQALTALKDANVSIDAWIDRGSGRFIGLQLKGASKADPTQTFEVALSLKAPDAGTSLDAPASSVEVPLMQLLGPMLQQLMQGAGSS